MSAARGIPETLEEALDFEQPDHDLMNRSTAGPSVGAMAGVSFGTGSEREKQHAHLADFYKSGGPRRRAASEWQQDAAGAGRRGRRCRHPIDPSARTRICSHPVFPAAPASGSRMKSCCARLTASLQARQVEQAAAEMAEYRERSTPSRFSTDLDTILKAAVEGRVHRLYLDRLARKLGVFHGAKRGEPLGLGRRGSSERSRSRDCPSGRDSVRAARRSDAGRSGGRGGFPLLRDPGSSNALSQKTHSLVREETHGAPG